MKFPRDHASRLLSSGEIDIPDNFWELDMNLLGNMVCISGDAIAEKEASRSQLKSSLHQNFLFRVAHFVSDGQRIDKASFKMLDTIFYGVADTWLRMKDEVAARKGLDAQQYKFKPRVFKIKCVLADDVAAFGTLLKNDTLSEWEELFAQGEGSEKMDTTEDYESMENEWEHVHETTADNMIGIHNRLFGSTNVIDFPGAFHVSDRERLISFTDSYTIGARMIKGLAGPSFPSLDAKLVAEHQLRLCLEHEQNYVSSQELSAKYNFYKDSNAPAVAKMVKLLISLVGKIGGLLSEWEEHPGVQKIKDTIEMLLNIPMDTPVAKALSGLQFLMNMVKTLQEDGSKFSLSDQLEPLVALVCSWKKMEFDSWPALLDEVQDQYETNAAKLWFPLYSVLNSSNVRHEQSIIESLEVFIQTSSIGEFRKRLQLLFAFHGQITVGRSLKVERYSSDWQERILDMLYNVFGYYVQFLPRIVEHVQAHRKNIEMELKELLKLCRWERPETCLSIENSRRTRQKLRKLIQKYTDLLQQPLSLVLTQATSKGIDIGSPQGLVPPSSISEDSFGVLANILDQMQLDDKERSMSLSGWKKVVDTLQNLQFDKTFKSSLLDSKGTWYQFSTSQSTYPLNLECQSKLWQTIKKICKTSLDCNEIWEDVTKGAGKKRALSELLKLLESSGLQKHKFETAEVSNNTSSFFRQPSYNARHLLLTQSRLVCGAPDLSMADEFQGLSDHSLDREWKTANEFYFKSAASVRVLQQTCLVPHEDITRDQATRSVSFLNHLMIIQQEQRSVAYGFAKDLKCLYESVHAFENMYTKCTGATGSSESCIAPNQNTVVKCMQKQKELFDGLVAMLIEESLLLKKVESTHFKSCQSVRTAASNAVHAVEKFIPIIQKAREKSKESLRNHLLACSGAIWSHSEQLWNDTHLGIGAMSAVSCNQFVVSKKMELTLYENFEVMENFEKHVLEFCQHDLDKSPVIESLHGNFDGLLKKGKLLAEQLKSLCNGAIASTNHFEELKCCTESGSHSATKAGFDEAVKRTFDLVMNVLKNNWSPNNGQAVLQDSSMNITMWESLYKTSVQNLNLKEICDNILKTIFHAESLLNHSTSRTPSLSLHVGMCFEHLHVLLDAVLSFGDGILKDFLAMHKTGAIMTHVLANVLASLFSKGFRIPSKDKEEDASHDVSQDASGTGMGEGSGRQDVSDQITDEDQLLGSSQKPGEELDDSKEVPKENNKGIEMEEDFMADACSVSEDSEEEGGDADGDGDEQLDNAMGEAGPSSEVVDEKLWNKEEDEKPSDTTEKYESGPSVRDRDGNSQELRAKEDSTAIDNNEHEELNYDEPPHENGEIGDQKDLSDIEENEGDTKMDKEEASTDPSGIKLDEVNQSPDEDMDVDEEMNEGVEEIGQGQENESPKDENFEEESATPSDGTKEEAVTKQIDEASEEKEPGRESEEKLEMNSMTSTKDDVGPGIADLMDDYVPSGHSGTQPTGNFKESSSINGAPEAVMSDAIEDIPNFTPLRSLPHGDISGVDVMVSDPSNMGSLADNPEQAENTQKPSSSLQNPQPNPYRSVGDALEEWKERVKVSMDLQEENQGAHDETDDENAKEYGYVSKNEEGTAQALGSATSEQIDTNVPSYERDDDTIAAQKDDDAKMEIAKPEFEELYFKNKAPLFSHKEEETQMPHYDDIPEVELAQTRSNHQRDSGKSSENFVSVRKFFSDDMPLGDLSIDDDELGKAQVLELISVDPNSDSASLWRKYQMRTTRLSQELAEQLRLVMEPTLASKLQGDYRTGKRINMKKVIPYIASHYRKDKIWLRRTRPNKRDYQVVIAVDDSRSMSESYCGDVAVESLVTVCNAMSQLEMGSMAVASFGKKGNIRLLHDFDQPFTVESGMKIISSLSFKQENTIADEPVVDLLKYLNDMLDVAVANARLPSGHNPLQQLVLIIGDGQFHERAKLKRCVRDFSSQKRMVAFLILDNGQESIVNREEATIGAGNMVKFTKYLDSFPFPYYIVLKNIEALPRTLGDLLRQWFEVMQTSRD